MDSNEVGLYRLAASVPELSIAALISWQSSQTHLKRATETINNERVCKAFSNKISKRRGGISIVIQYLERAVGGLDWHLLYTILGPKQGTCTMNIPYYVLQEAMESSTFPNKVKIRLMRFKIYKLMINLTSMSPKIT